MKRMDPLYFFCQSFSRVLLRVFFGMRVYGRQWFPKEGSVIVAVNHVSAYDPVIIGSVSPRELHFLAKVELFKNPLVGSLLRHLHAIPLNRSGSDTGALRRAFHVLQERKPLLLFPEGTRSKNGEIGEPRNGVGMLAYRSQTDILPVYLEGSFRLFSHLLKKRVTVHFGKPIPIARFNPNGLSVKETYRHLGEVTIERIRELKNESHH